MNLHEVGVVNEHELFGKFDLYALYWCSCGWTGNGLSRHAVEAGLVNNEERSLLYYCIGHNTGTRGICNRILTKAGTDCGDHKL